MNDEEIKETFCRPGDERALIYYALDRMDDFYSICSKVDESAFLYQEHKMIYILLKTLLDKGIKKFDVSMIINEAKNNGILKNIGGYEYLESISRMSLDKGNLDTYVDNVLESATKHRLYIDLKHGLNKIINNAKSGENSEALIGSIEARIMDLSTRSKSIREPQDLGEGLEEYIEERMDNPVEMSGISTGYPILDQQIDGLVPGTLTIVSARKKMGKSAFLSNVAAHVAYLSRIPVLYVDTEMTFKEWRNRIIAMLSGIDERIIKHGGYTKEQRNIIEEKCLKIVKKGQLFHQHMPGYSVDKITALYKKYKLKENIGLGVFDYIKEPESTSLDRHRAEWQTLGDVTTRIKDLAGELDIPFLAAVQINRGGEVAGSDRISWFGDIVMQWMHKKTEELEAGGMEGGQFKLVIRDTRRGGGTPEEGIGYKFRKKKLQIKEVEAPFQLIQYGEVVDYGSDDEELT